MASELQIEIGKKLKQMGGNQPAVRGLGYKRSTVSRVWVKMQKGWDPDNETPSSQDDKPPEARGKGRVISELEMVMPAEKVRESEQEVSEDEGAKGAGSGEAKEGGDGQKPLRTVVAGQGLTFQITISTKTLQLYQIAASMQEEELTIGDFIDTCVEDYYRGRGFDLGLIKIGGEGKNG